MDMWWESRCRCFRGLKDRWNAQSVLDGELTSSDGALANQVRYPEGIPRRARSISLRAFFERIRFAAQECERFAGEMEGTGDQDSFLRCPRGG